EGAQRAGGLGQRGGDLVVAGGAARNGRQLARVGGRKGLGGHGHPQGCGGVTTPATAADVPAGKPAEIAELHRRPWVTLPGDESGGLRMTGELGPRDALGGADGRGAVSPR